MKQAISSVAMVVPDYDEAIAFYIEKVGFELVDDIDIGRGKRWVTVRPKGGETALLLALATTPEQKASIGNQTGGRVGFFLETDNFQRDYLNMMANGITFEEPPRQEPYGQVVVWRDPFGNRWDLIERAA
ncbi:VOC family protein [Alphaproteobacteria bacterium KMM 3653]|uniref:VOC family protein n=1 Tax=Harenicola maris TaxID=2841044 RepID=A0AAP2CP11_9RHOB|nr:VOC family protein [Harenicola maris]